MMFIFTFLLIATLESATKNAVDEDKKSNETQEEVVEDKKK